jgi:hypothetical protein
MIATGAAWSRSTAKAADGEKMVEILLSALGIILIIFLGSEECRLGLRRLRGILEQRPYLKFAVYPLGAALLLVTAGLIANSILRLLAAAKFYE